MLTELPELKEEEKMMERIELKLNKQLIRLREEELALKRLIRERGTTSTSAGLEIIEDDETLLSKESTSILSSIGQHAVGLPKLTDKISSGKLAAGELAVNQIPLSQLGSSLMPDDAFSEDEEEDEEDEDESSKNLMEIWKSMGQT